MAFRSFNRRLERELKSRGDLVDGEIGNVPAAIASCRRCPPRRVVPRHIVQHASIILPGNSGSSGHSQAGRIECVARGRADSVGRASTPATTTPSSAAATAAATTHIRRATT